MIKKKLPPGGIDKCPVCGGVLQATLTDFVTNCVIDSKGTLLRHDDDSDDTAIYCENGHELYEIVAAIQKQEPTTP